MRSRTPLFLLASTAVGLLVSMGCTLSASSGLVPATSFVYPNSNVVAHEEVSGRKSSMCGFVFLSWGPGPDAQDIALQRALKAADEADLLINARYTSKMTFWLIPWICSTTVSGTAATMEVGMQDLGGGPLNGDPNSSPPAEQQEAPPSSGGRTRSR